MTRNGNRKPEAGRAKTFFTGYRLPAAGYRPSVS